MWKSLRQNWLYVVLPAVVVIGVVIWLLASGDGQTDFHYPL